mmetsp:Transcript_10585/g.29624  ORF Transcript_10585/g.29624 Transcript_10585/m.29624 type:complete len:241 (+) Transcript_10585:87-809(+)
MDFDRESLLAAFLEDEADVAKIKAWCEENDHKRSDIFEWRLSKSDELREEGNALFKSGDYETAVQRYFAAIYHLDFDVGQQWNMMECHMLDLNTRKLKVVSNICAAYMKAKDWVNTKAAADIGLRHMQKAELKDKHAEARLLYRKGMANMERGFTEEAYQSLKQAAIAKPSDAEIRQGLLEASEGQKKDRREAKKVWKGSLLTEEEKACEGSWWQGSVAMARFRVWRARCRRRLRPPKAD